MFLCSRALYNQQSLLRCVFLFHGPPYTLLQLVPLWFHVAFSFVISIKIAKLGGGRKEGGEGNRHQTQISNAVRLGRFWHSGAWNYKAETQLFSSWVFFSVNFSPVRHPALSISPNLVVWVSSVISGEGSAPLEGDSQANELPIRASPLSLSCWERR